MVVRESGSQLNGGRKPISGIVCRHEQVEQTVEVPVPMTQEEVVHVPTAAWRASGRRKSIFLVADGTSHSPPILAVLAHRDQPNRVCVLNESTIKTH